MSWWGKLIGGYLGFALGGPLGALLGAVIGHNFDKSEPAKLGGPQQGNQQRAQAAFFTATFSVMGHLCKADGQVTEDEIDTARRVMAQMALSAEQKKTAMRLFTEGKKEDFPLQDVLIQLNQELGAAKNIKRAFIEILCSAAYADGVMHAGEKKLLYRISETIGFSRYELDSIAAAIAAEYHHKTSGKAGVPGKMSLKDAHAILNITPEASKDEVKRAYRRQISQHHPDKLIAKGLPEEMIQVATQRSQEIREAYDRIMEQQ